MHKPKKQLYLPPRVFQTVTLRLERSLLTASVAKEIQPVETAGQEIDGLYDGTNKTDGTKQTFNYDWGE